MDLRFSLNSEPCALQDIILAWYEKESAAKSLGVTAEVAKAVRAATAPLVEWLESAESGAEESESDDEYGPDLEENPN